MKKHPLRILIVDDMEHRHSFFKKKFIGHLLIHARTYQEAEVEIKANPYSFDAMFLDHDLSEESIMCDPDNCPERTGTDLARFIARTIDNDKVNDSFIIYCHSLNPSGRQKMVDILTDAGFKAINIPFTSLTN